MSTQPFGRAPDGHLDVEVVSDLVEGLLTPDQTASVEDHLVHCEACRDVRDALAEIHGTLGPETLRTASSPEQPEADVAHINGAHSPAFRSAPRETSVSSGDTPGPTPPRSTSARRDYDSGSTTRPRLVTVLILISVLVAAVLAVSLILVGR